MVKGVTGLGLPLFATPILAGAFGARPAVVIMSIPVVVTNFLLVYEGRRDIGVFREVWPIAAAGAVGVVIGLALLVRLDQNVLALVIAALVFVFLLRGERVLGEEERGARTQAAGLALGLLSGVLNGTTSISSPLIAGYLHAKRVEARRFVVSLAVIFQVFSIVQVLGLARLGLYDAETLTFGALGLIPTVAALTVGQRLRRRLQNETFRRAIVLLLALSALNLVYQGVHGLGLL